MAILATKFFKESGVRFFEDKKATEEMKEISGAFMT
jgi:hypothetical protein